MNRRIRFLLGFGGLAVVLLVVFNMWYPPVNEEATSGAVVAVEKHRQQQIAPQDVILGDEATRKAEQVLYGGYLEDAAKLENVSAELALALRNRQAQDADLGVVRTHLEAASKELASHSNQLQLRALESARHDLGLMRELLAAAPRELAMRGEIEAQLGQIAQMIENRSAIDSAAMESISIELASASNKLESQVLSLAGVESAKKSLEALGKNLENKNIELAAATAELAVVTRNLGRSAAIDAASLEHHAAYLAAMAKENRSIESARKTLDAAVAELAAANKLEAANAQALEAASRQLLSQAAELETLAVANLESRAALLSLENKAIADLDSALGVVAKSVENRAQLSAAARQDLQLGLQSADLALANRAAAMNKAVLASAQLELAAVGRFVDNRAALESRWAEASALGKSSPKLNKLAEYLGRMSAVYENHRALAAQQVLENRSSAENRSVLANQQQLEQELGAQARQIQNRLATLDSASRE